MRKKSVLEEAVDNLMASERMKLTAELIMLRCYTSEELEPLTLTELVERFEAITGQSW